MIEKFKSSTLDLAFPTEQHLCCLRGLKGAPPYMGMHRNSYVICDYIIILII